MKKILIFIITLSFLGANELLEKIDRNLQPVSSESYKKLTNIEPNGSKKQFLLYQAKREKRKWSLSSWNRRVKKEGQL